MIVNKTAIRYPNHTQTLDRTKSIFTHLKAIGYPMRAVRDDRYKLIRNLAPENRYTINGIHKGPLIESWQQDAKSSPELARRVEWLFKRPAAELYDLENDPLESVNLAGAPT